MSAPTPDAVLVVEDDLDTRELLVELLSLDGVSAVGTDTVAGARTLLGARAFACVVLDKNLPDGSGLDILRAVREETPEIEAVLLTGSADLGSAVEALRLGASDYLFKPVDPTLFRRRLAFLLDRRRARDDNRRLQARLLESERAGSVGVLAAALTHELTSPLAYVTANLNFLRDRLEELAPPARQELLEVLDESREGMERMKATIDQVRLLEQSYREQVGLVDVREALALALELVSPLALHGRSVRRELRAVPKVKGTRAQLLQVFLEVLRTAIGPEHSPSREVRVRLGADERWVQLDVGAEPAPPEFAAFTGAGSLLSVPRSQPPLGAQVCRGIVASIGGACELRDEGASLRLRFPVGEGTAPRELLDPDAPVGEWP